MARPQVGVYAEPNLHGLTLLMNVMTDDVDAVRRKLARIPSIASELDDRFSESMLSVFVAIGSDYWDHVYPQQRPAQLGSFPELRDGDRQAPRESVDLMLCIRSDRFDVNFQSGRTFLEWLGHDVELLDEIRTFRFMDGRDLTGFIESPDNPHGMRRRQFATIKAEDDKQFAGGAYLFMQKFRHDLRRWAQLSVDMQEHVMGRQKISSERISEAALSLVTHAQKSRLVDANDQPLLLLRHNMPWGDLREQGLLAMYFSGEAQHLVRWLKQRYIADSDGDYDPLLDYIEAVENGAYFAPSIDFLEQLGQSKC